MAAAKKRHSVDAEPHLTGHSFTPDPSEHAAEKRLERDTASADPQEERARYSVFDEPGTLPSRVSIRIESDWYCRTCGYNLRGLMTGHPCPECGKIELYEPPRESEVTYAQWLAGREPRATVIGQAAVAALIALAAVPCGAIGALLGTDRAGLLSFAVIGPLIAETLKMAGVVILVERDSPAVRRRWVIVSFMVVAAIGFAVGQNVVYLLLLYQNSGVSLLAYRWMFGPVLHCICSVIVARGLILARIRARMEQRRITLGPSYPYMIAAIVAHCLFNAFIYFRGYAGYGF